MIGTDIIVSANSLGFKLRSGYTLLYGGCTSKPQYSWKEGDVVSYSGYLKEGYVHGVSLSQFK